MDTHFEPAYLPWKDLTVPQRGEIVWSHEMLIPDYDSLNLFMQNVKRLVWSRDSRPPENRLVKRPTGLFEITGLWYGYNQDRSLAVNPPSMIRFDSDMLEGMESSLHAPSIVVTISPYAAKMIARVLVQHADNRRVLADDAKGLGCASAMCLEAAEEAEAAARVLTKRISQWDAENLVW